MRIIALLVLLVAASWVEAAAADPVPRDWLARAMATVPECGPHALDDASLNPAPRLVEIGVHFIGGKVVVTDAAITHSSGNPAFDKRVADCFRNLPPDMTAKLGIDVTLFLHVYANNGALVLLSNPPPPPIVPPPAVPPPPPFANAITVQHVPATAPPRVAITSPASIGTPHNCYGFYPPLAMRLNQTGSTMLKFTISTAGTVKDISVASSSGHDILDQAAVLCSGQWRYKPATRDGVPLEVPWQVIVKWDMEYPVIRDILVAGDTCAHTPPPSSNDLKTALGPTVVAVKFSNGTVTAVTWSSSGNAHLDERAARCFANLPPDLTQQMTGELTQFVPIVWTAPTPSTPN